MSKWKCPNCGDECCPFAVGRLFSCNECGAVSSEGSLFFVPKRSQPAEVRELPDQTGEWNDGEAQVIVAVRYWQDGLEWIVIAGSKEGRSSSSLWRAIELAAIPRGRYVRAQPPIVPPEQEKEPTAAEKLAMEFHRHYETLAPAFEYSTRPDTAKVWSEVPEPNKSLMIATASAVIEQFGIADRIEQQGRE